MSGIKQDIEAQTLSIQEVSERSGLSVPTLRYYEEVGIIDAVERDKSSGHRRYTVEEAEVIEAVACLRAVGLGLEEMKAYGQLRKRGDAAAVERGDMFKAHLQVVNREIELLMLRKDYLELKIKYWDAKAAGNQQEADRLAQDFRAYANRLRSL